METKTAEQILKIKEFIGKAKFDDAGSGYIFGQQADGHLQTIAEVRGWGAIQNMFPTHQEAAEFQDALGGFIVDAINAYAPPGETSLDVHGKSKGMKTAKEIASEYGWTSPSIIAAMEEYASQYTSPHPLPLQSFTMGDMEGFVEYADNENYSYLGNGTWQGDNEQYISTTDLIKEFITSLKKK